ncbi:ATP-binding protein [Candidatus Omnitrophota bacterium]
MLGGEYFIYMLGLLSFIALVIVVVMLVFKMDELKILQSTVDNLKTSLDEMDEQAKLIIRTDVELNKTQGELDKKLSGLYGLQKVSQEISTTLEEERVFEMLDPEYLQKLGFDRACVFLWDETNKEFLLRFKSGYPEQEIERIKKGIDANKNMYVDLTILKKNVSSGSTKERLIQNKINDIFRATSFVVSPILPKEGSKGFLFAGTQDPDASITAGDEELIAILANQISQALENARLFEQTWKAHQELEKKVELRTRELSAALEKVKQANKRKSDFVSSVTHELRTPLTSVKGYASILLSSKKWKLPEDVRTRLEKINRHSDELSQFVNDLLDISRIESGRVTMKAQDCSIKDILDASMEILSVLLKEKNIEFSSDMTKDALRVLADVSQIKRVFINLINNAIKFTPEKGRISVSSCRQDDQIQIDIADTGCGISREAQGKIFEEFYRDDNPINQEVKGSGLGLALVKNIIEANKGKIWVKSKIGTGSTFSFTLPIAA